MLQTPLTPSRLRGAAELHAGGGWVCWPAPSQDSGRGIRWLSGFASGSQTSQSSLWQVQRQPPVLNNPACPRALSGEDSSPTQLTQSPLQTTGEGKEFRCPSSAFVIESPLVQERFQIYAAILEIITHPHPINFISACMFAAWCSKAIFATNWATEFTFTW